MIDNPLALFAILLGSVFVSLKLVERYLWAERLSAVMVILFLTALISNVGLIPTQAPVYGTIIGFSVPFAVCVILFTVNLGDVVKAGKPMLAAFVLAALGTAVGVAVASITMEPLLSDILGADSWKLAGPYTGTFIGGSLNFFSLWTGLEIDNPDLLAAANAVDNLSLFPLYAAWVWIPTMLAGRWITARHWAVAKDSESGKDDKEITPPFEPVQIVTITFLAVSVMALSEWLKTTLIDAIFPQLPSILILTTLALILAQWKPVRQLRGAMPLGQMAFYLFFAAVGALINIYHAVVLAPALFAYVLIIMISHFIILFGIGRLLKMDISVLTIASVATKAGPAFVAPIAALKGWNHLILPGILLGMLGYAVGNYAGLAVAYAVKAMTSG
jgi:uncharacterized membrane protein